MNDYPYGENDDRIYCPESSNQTQELQINYFRYPRLSLMVQNYLDPWPQRYLYTFYFLPRLFSVCLLFSCCLVFLYFNFFLLLRTQTYLFNLDLLIYLLVWFLVKPCGAQSLLLTMSSGVTLGGAQGTMGQMGDNHMQSIILTTLLSSWPLAFLCFYLYWWLSELSSVHGISIARYSGSTCRGIQLFLHTESPPNGSHPTGFPMCSVYYGWSLVWFLKTQWPKFKEYFYIPPVQFHFSWTPQNFLVFLCYGGSLSLILFSNL